MTNGTHFSAKHYIFLLLWWLSMGYALANKAVGLGILFVAGFFLISTFKLFKKLIIVMAVVFIATTIFPPIAAVIAGLSFVFMLLRIKFLLQNWRALAVGIYAYFVYLAVVVFNGFFFKLAVIKIASLIAGFFQDNAVVQYGSTAVVVASYLFALALTIIFHRLLNWLYAHGYSTERAFHVMGLTPLFLIAVILPFLKIQIDGHEIFHGSFSDGIGDVDVDGIDVNTSLPTNVSTALDMADVDVGSMLDVNTAIFSPAIETSFASAAAHGLFKVSGDFTIRKEDGSEEKVTYTDATHAVISDSSGQKLGTVTFDEKQSREIVKLSNGVAYTIDQISGEIISADGKILGRFKDDDNGGKILTDAHGKIIREFRANGFILDGNRHTTATVSA